MELNAAFRTVVLGHRRLIALFVIVPLVIVGVLGARRSHLYTATARVQATNATMGSDTEADSVLNLVRGIATSDDVVRGALRRAGLDERGTGYTAQHRISLTRLGSSPVIDIGVTEPTPAAAMQLADALAESVVKSLRRDGQQPELSALARLRADQQSLNRQQARLTSALAGSVRPRDVRTLSTQLSNVEAQLTQTSAAIQQLQATVAAASSAALLSRPGSANPIGSSLPLRLVLIGFGGLIAGLLLAAIAEMIKPKVADARNAARELDAPLLGRLTEGSADPLTALSVHRVAERAKITTLVVAGANDADNAATLGLELLMSQVPGSANGHFHAQTEIETATTTRPRHATPVTTARRVTRADAKTFATTLRVVAISAITTTDVADDVGLLVAVAPRMPRGALRHAREVAAATGWPVLGVLDVPSKGGIHGDRD